LNVYLEKCVLGYIVALANEKGGKLVLGMADQYPHGVVGSDFAEGNTGNLEDEIYTRIGIRVKTEELHENDMRVLVIHVPSRPIGRLLKNGTAYSPNTDFIALQNAATDKTENKTTQKTTQKTASALSPKQQEILNYLSQNPFASRKELSENISGISEDGVKYNLKGLQQKGVIKHIGPDKGGHWEVISGNKK
jgi:predicted HTH transcriptional regulator